MLKDVKDFTVSLFDKLRVDQEDPNYITITTPEPRTDNKKADNPEFGQISNVEPLYETVRASRYKMTNKHRNHCFGLNYNVKIISNISAYLPHK